MINTQEQEELFKLVADYMEKNITCIAIGGTAMMFANYKTTTKDIDLVFQNEKDRKIFIEAIEELGYREKAIGNIYDTKRKTHKEKPKMFSRGDERFDLFLRDVFGYRIEFEQDRMRQRNDYLGKKELTILQPAIEELILLKAITRRDKDHEDIETIMEIEKKIDWKKIVQKAIKQKEKSPWILIDLEETLQNLKKKFFIKGEIFEMIYQAQER